MNFTTMDFKRAIGDRCITRERLKGEFPIYLLYVRMEPTGEDFVTLDYDWVMSSCVREMNERDAQDRVDRYNTSWVIKNEISDEVKSETTHLVSGYYDVLEDEFHSMAVRECNPLDADVMSSVFVEGIMRSTAAFSGNKELFTENLKFITRDRLLHFLMFDDLTKGLDIFSVFSLIIGWCEAVADDANYKLKSGHVVFPAKLLQDELQHCCVPEKDKNGKFNFWNLVGCLRSHGLLDYGVVNRLTMECSYFSDAYECHDVKDIEKNPDNYLQVALVHKVAMRHLFSGRKIASEFAR